MTIEVDDDEKEEKEIAQVLTPEACLEETKTFQSAASVYFTYFMDLNSNIYVNPIISSPVFPETNVFSQGFDQN